MRLIGCPIDSTNPEFFEEKQYALPINTYNSTVNCQQKKTQEDTMVQSSIPVFGSLTNTENSNLEDLMKQQIFLLKLVLLFLGFLVIGRFIDK